jgi:hypothetical protein
LPHAFQSVLAQILGEWLHMHVVSAPLMQCVRTICRCHDTVSEAKERAGACKGQTLDDGLISLYSNNHPEAMGNVLAQPQRLQPELVADLPSIVFKDTLSKEVASVASPRCQLG